MKKKSFTLGLIAFLALTATSGFAQKGVWVPAGGDIEGFQIATGTFQNNLYVSGMDYKSAMPKSYIKKFNGVFWTTLVEIGGFNNSISVMKEYNGELYVGGQFIEFEGITNANSLVKWNGSKWSAVGTGFGKTSFAQVRTLEVFNNKLYVGGGFDSIAGIQLKNIAVWNGTAWSAGPKCESSVGTYTIVQSLKTFNGNLFIGGTFDKLVGVPHTVNSKNAARFDGTEIYSLSNGLSNGTNSEVSGFEIFKNELYLYGSFSLLDTIPVNGIAKWDNSILKKLTKQPSGGTQSMKALGNNLFSCGSGWNSNVEYYDGSIWDAAGQSKLVGEGAKLEVFKDRLYVFGGFISSDSSSFVFSGSAMLLDASDACKVEGVVFLDSDKSCTKNNGEKGIAKRTIEIKPIGLKIFTDSIGYFSLFLEKGNYSAKLLPYPYYYKTCKDSIAFSFTQKGEKTDTLYFGSYIKDTVFDGSVKITSSNARPGFTIYYYVNAVNKGTASQNCTLKVILDNNFTYSSLKGRNYSRFSGNTMEWDIAAFKPNEIIHLDLIGTVKIGTPIGTKMKTYSVIVPATADANMSNNSDTAFNYVRSSFDPNDKQVYPIGIGANGFVGKNTNQSLRYHIRFQNTGNDTAFNIVIIDTLSSNLDPSTFEEVGASHSYIYELLNGNVLKFTFPNILLADSAINKAESHGYVTFNINPIKGLVIGSKIKNNADIYFDFNEPVRTNTTITSFDNAASVNSIITNDILKIYPNPGLGVATIELTSPINCDEIVTLEITDLYGKVIYQTTVKNNKFEIDMTGFVNSVYIFKINRNNDKTINVRYIKAN